MSLSTEFKSHDVAHHFESAKQEFDACKLGMWAFLAQEILFFSGLFVAYIIFRMQHFEMFKYASELLDWRMGALNTLVLIASSFTMAMGVRSAQTSQKKATIRYLILTFIFAGMFMCVKYFEYSSKFHHGYLPAQFFDAAAPFETLHLYFGLYFTMTALHGLHVLIGMGLIFWLIRRAKRGEFHSEYYTPVEMVGLYWHLVDLIWIFLFPLLYLIT
ncbi:MAG: cytochrome C oxidase subunit III [Actinobacteria bacterium]|nr:cytochrome C oxidase subunit III [Actinomycetota bacterium]